MSMIRWEPMREMMSLRRAMDRLLEDSFVRPASIWTEMAEGEMSIDMYQTDNDIVVKAALPGVRPEDVDISVTGDTLTIKGESSEETKEEKKDYIYQERRYGSFSRSVTLPVPVNSDKAEASFENGILTVSLPKAEEVKPKQIKVGKTGAARQISGQSQGSQGASKETSGTARTEGKGKEQSAQ